MATLLVVFLAGLLAAVPFVLRQLHSCLWVPRRQERRFRQQGVRGPPRRPMFGNAGEYRALTSAAQAAPLTSFHHGIVPRVAPHCGDWPARYGRPFVFWLGPWPRLVLSDPEAVKAVLSDSTGSFVRIGSGPGVNPLVRQLFGSGLVVLTGEKWSHHRRVIAPAFNMERVKSWIPEIADMVSTMVDKWAAQGETRSEFEIDVSTEFRTLTADIISHVAFGSSYEEGKRVFQLQEEEINLLVHALRTVYIPGFRFLPTKKNRRIKSLKKEIRDILHDLIEINGRKCEGSKNLLGLMLAAGKADSQNKMDIEEIIDECKTFYLAGKESTSNSMTWAALLLALHQDWQDKARQEVIQVCGRYQHPTADNLSSLKIVNMVLKETLRLYPPAGFLHRIATKDVKLGKLDIPGGTQLQIPILAVHHDVDLWGSNADEFDPTRFADGKSHRLGAYLPFGVGPTICVGQNLAMVEAKLALAILLQRFTFTVSPSYVHAPMNSLTVQPQYGAQILFHKI